MKIKLFDRAFSDEDKANVEVALSSGWVTEGPWAERVEDRLMKITGSRHVILFPSGTIALWAAFRTHANMTARSVDPHDVVNRGPSVACIPDHTFCATLAAALEAGWLCRLVDSDMNSMEVSGELTVPVHLYGSIMKIPNGVKPGERIDDACQALGVYDEDSVHAGGTAKAAALSFYADKLCTSGEGGAVFTNDPEFADRLRVFKNVGRHKRGGYLHPYHGLTLRMTDMQCALLYGQLGRLEEIRANRTAVEAAYLKYVKLETNQVWNAGIKRMPNRFIYKTLDPDRLIAWMEKKGVECRRTFVPLHRNPWTENRPGITRMPSYGRSWGAYQGTVYLPFGMNLTTEQAEEIGRMINNYEDDVR
ncbi:MAG: DegT/DnrJ/EryC1/StrS family aminotransferase [Candidatus Eisenbacteria bacterium]|nr:DegT/DnrJ/EryC1/StrS family aminotransferase [Candidatus Eisenbacteria bacterium]